MGVHGALQEIEGLSFNHRNTESFNGLQGGTEKDCYAKRKIFVRGLSDAVKFANVKLASSKSLHR